MAKKETKVKVPKEKVAKKAEPKVTRGVYDKRGK